MSRAMILPYPADPFLLNFWLKGFRNIWYDEIDRLYIYCNSPIEGKVIDFISKIAEDPKITFFYDAQQVPHGVAIDNMLNFVTEDYVGLIEDDAFVLRHGVISECFRVLEDGKYDIVASPRGSCSFEIMNRGAELWGAVDTGGGDNGCNFWPCFYFSKKQVLLDTDRNFDSKSWKAGTYIDALQTSFDVDVVGDTFVNTSLQLRAKYPPERILIIPQFHSYVTDIDDYHENRYIFSGKCPWFHVGSLSSGVSGVLMDDRGRALSMRLINDPQKETILPPHCNTPAEKQEWERRVAWWLTFAEQAPANKIPQFLNLYKLAVERVIQQYALSRKTITTRQTVFRKVMGKYYV